MSANTAFGNILSRLQGLKNVSGRRVMPGAEFLRQEEEQPDIDLSGTNPPQTPPIYKNYNNNQALETGQADASLPLESNQGVDVRANTVIPQEEKEQPGFLNQIADDYKSFLLPGYEASKNKPMPQQNPEQEGLMARLGQSLGLISRKSEAQAPPIETAQVDAQEGLPPITASEQDAAMQQGLNDNSSENLQPSPSIPPQTETAQEKDFGSFAEPGAVKSAYSDKNISSEVGNLLGVKITPKLLEEVKPWESVLSDYSNANAEFQRNYTNREREIKERIDSRKLSDKDQILMALALLAPAALAGVTLGKGGFFNVLAGGAGALSNVLGQKNKEQLLDEQKLDELALGKLKGQKEQFESGLKNEQLLAKAPKGVNLAMLGDKVVVDSGNPLFPLTNTNMSEKDLINFKTKKLPIFEKKLTSLQDSLATADKMYDLLDKSEKQNKQGFIGDVKNKDTLYLGTLARGLKSAIPAFRDHFTDENGNDVKFADIYESERAKLLDDSNFIATGSQNRPKHAEENFNKKVPNPFDLPSFVTGKSNVAEVKGQLKSYINSLRESLEKELENSGVDNRVIKQMLSESGMKKQESESSRQKKRAEEAAKIAKGQK